jgi:glycosyltransferase involved in cell wall biosynthesis
VRVLHVAPLWFPISAQGPGGIETLLAALVSALKAAGAEVTLAATADTDVDCPVVGVVERGLFAEMREGRAAEYEYFEQHLLREALALAGEHDLVHSHIGPAGFILSAVSPVPVVHTIHGTTGADLAWFAARHPDVWLTTVSEHQAAPLRAAGARRCRVVPNGVALDAFPAGDGGGPLAFLGRMESEKGPDLAIAAARALGRELTLAGPVTDGEFFAREVEPRLGDGIDYAGVLGHPEKARLLGEASCAVMPSRWPEPFGLVAVEAMACGTPVAALPSGALPELVEPGVTGALADAETALPDAIRRAERLDRAAVRRRAGERFGIAEVARRYLDLYEEVLA